MPEPEHGVRLPAAPARPADGHKGTFGTVIVVGGCATMPGAPALAAGAAFRGGAGLVKIAADERTLAMSLVIEPSATGVLLQGGVEQQAAQIDAADPGGRAVLAVGPGMGQSAQTEALVTHLLHGGRALVLDADGLNVLARSGRRHRGQKPLVMTPHPGEFERLARAVGTTAKPTGDQDRAVAAGELARAHHATVVLKGARTIVSGTKGALLNTTGNPCLATAGSGDVLTGLIAALLAQGMAPLDAARLAVHTHGKAADNWAEQFGHAGMKASELIDWIPAVLNPLRAAAITGP